MANYEAQARSNYFAVKSAPAFMAWAESRSLGLWEKQGLFALYPEDGAWPSYDDENDDFIDLEGELAEHLVPGHVTILLEVGFEKLRYLVGTAVIVSATETRYVNLHEAAMQLAEQLGQHVTPVEY